MLISTKTGTARVTFRAAPTNLESDGDSITHETIVPFKPVLERTEKT